MCRWFKLTNNLNEQEGHVLIEEDAGSIHIVFFSMDGEAEGGWKADKDLYIARRLLSGEWEAGAITVSSSWRSVQYWLSAIGEDPYPLRGESCIEPDCNGCPPILPDTCPVTGTYCVELSCLGPPEMPGSATPIVTTTVNEEARIYGVARSGE